MARCAGFEAALAASGLLMVLAASGLLDKADWSVSDAWYQSRSTPEEDVDLVGIDERTIQEIGPYQRGGGTSLPWPSRP